MVVWAQADPSPLHGNRRKSKPTNFLVCIAGSDEEDDRHLCTIFPPPSLSVANHAFELPSSSDDARNRILLTNIDTQRPSSHSPISTMCFDKDMPLRCGPGRLVFGAAGGKGITLAGRKIPYPNIGMALPSLLLISCMKLLHLYRAACDGTGPREGCLLWFSWLRT